MCVYGELMCRVYQDAALGRVLLAAAQGADGTRVVHMVERSLGG
jgi:hypothetical protein